MTKGEGLVALLYAIKDIIESFAIMIITGGAILAFFWTVIRFLNAQRNGSTNTSTLKNQMFLSIFLLFVIFSVYSLIALTGSIFGVNSSPSGGLYVQ